MTYERIQSDIIKFFIVGFNKSFFFILPFHKIKKEK